jgi:hypothetical protein
MMNQASEPIPFESEDEAFRTMLLQAGDCDARPSAEHVDRVRQALARRLMSVQRPRPRKSGRAWRWCGVGVGVAVLALVAFLQLQPRFVWAQVVQAVQERPWIHGTTKVSQGVVHEFWLSLPREVSATRNGEFVRYDDWRAGIRYEFDPGKKLLVRQPLSDDGEFESAARMFRAIFRAEPDVEFSSSGERTVKRDRRSIHVDGRSWLEYEWTLSRYDDSKTATATMRVDPERKLPVFLHVIAAGESLRYDFDYPADGPPDIYALGIPRDSRVDDQLPSLETSRIARVVEAGRKDLDGYFAVAYEYLTQAHLVWRKGDKWRLEFYLFRGDPGDLRSPAPGEDIIGWWKGQIRGKDAELHPILVCDGSQIWRHDKETGWNRVRYVAPGKGHDAVMSVAAANSYLLEFFAYPRIGSGGRFVGDPAQDSKKGATDSPRESQKSVRTLFQVGNADILNQRLWLDPEHGFATVRSESSFHLSPEEMQEPNPVVTQVDEFDMFRRTPRGVWYPTLWRSKQFRRDGTQAYAGQAVHFAVDFQAEIPDQWFTPSERK